jgi:hypothetical protein
MMQPPPHGYGYGPPRPELDASNREADEYELKLHKQGMVRYLAIGIGFIVVCAPLCLIGSLIPAGGIVLVALLIAKGVSHHGHKRRLERQLGRG